MKIYDIGSANIDYVYNVSHITKPGETLSSSDMQIFPGADRSSIMMTTSHKPGALFSVLSKFNAYGINIRKLESRPIPEKDFEFMFYFDLETSIYSEEFVQLMCELDELCEEFKYLGSYSEVV